MKLRVSIRKALKQYVTDNGPCSSEEAVVSCTMTGKPERRVRRILGMMIRAGKIVETGNGDQIRIP